MSPTRIPLSTLRALAATARTAVADAGAQARRARTSLRGLDVRRKGCGDFVTAVDLRIEARLRRSLSSAHPGHGFLGEEGGGSELAADFVWVVDPIDGTSNYARGLGYYAVAVACLHRGSPVVAAMSCQPEDRIYSAIQGLGAFRGRRRIRLGRGRLDDGSILGCQWHRASTSLDFVPGLVATGARLRNFGCTVVHLCEIAMGRLDGNVQEQGKIWDVAAPGLLVLEAGGRFTGWDGRPVFPFADLDGTIDYPTVAAPAAVHRRLLAALARTVSPA